MRIFKKPNIEFSKDSEPNSPNKVFSSVKDYFENQKFTNTTVIEQLPFILFISFLAIIYIANQYHAERLVNEVAQLKKQRTEKRSEYISSASNLMTLTRQSEVIKLVNENNLGLKALTSPPKKIIIEP